MWSKLKSFLKKNSSIFIISPTIALTVTVAQGIGFFNLSEWQTRDFFFRLRSHLEVKPDIGSQVVIVTIDEKDIQSVGEWPIPDAELADLIDKIRLQKPRAIG